MKRKSGLFILIIGLAWIGFIGCSSTSIRNQGVELGNPEPTPTIRITPQGRTTSYELKFLDEKLTSVTRTDSSSGASNTVLVPSQQNGATILVLATFPSLETIEVTLGLSITGEIDSASLKIDGQKVASAFEASGNFSTVGDTPNGKKAMAAQYQGTPGDDQIGPTGEAETVTVDLNQPNADTLGP